MLDNFNILVQRDPQNALLVASEQWKQTLFQAEVISPENDGREIKNIVIAGMGGSALAGLIVKKWLEKRHNFTNWGCSKLHFAKKCFEKYTCNYQFLLRNTEETVSALHQAIEIGAQIATISSHGKIEEIARSRDIAHV